MDRRLELHDKLLEIAEHVYYQPPEKEKILYDCILYERNLLDTDHADNRPYLGKTRYQLISITRDPDSDIPVRLSALPGCAHTSHYVSDNLHHDVFTLYY